MSELLNLPLLQGNKFIIIDEDVDSNCGKHLIFTWLQTIRKKYVNSSTQILLFSHTKEYFHRILKPFNLSNLQILDYFSIDLCNGKIDLYTALMNLVHQNIAPIIVLDCLTTLTLQIGLTKMCKFIEKINQNNNSQILCIYRKDFHINIPRIQALGNVYINFKKSKKAVFHSSAQYEVSVIQRKCGGSIVKWNELVHQNLENYSLISEQIVNNTDLTAEINSQSESSPKPQASFRIEMNEDELKQRKNLSLPYILAGNPGGQSKIIYVPDDFDDLDYEDPDDDLDI